ncbi:MAG: divergent polysaccharide deacetylase family protein [Paracoccaceae bacterium]
MASGRSGRGAYWLGAIVGLLISGALAAGLSIMAPLRGSAPEAESEAPAPEIAELQPSPASGGEPSAPEAGAAAPAFESAPVAIDAEPEGAAQQASREQSPIDAPPAPEPNVAASGPTVSQDAPPLASSLAPEAAVERTDAAPEPGPAGFAENRVPYGGDVTEPLLSIVLSNVDEARLEAVLNLIGPVAVVVAPGVAAPAAIAATLQGAGFEALSGLGVEALAGAGPVIGIAVEEGAADAAALVDAAAGGGLALLDLSAEGGSATYRMARGRGLPSAPAGRRIDSVANSDMVYQSLERAAFDARRTGAFVAVGEATPAVLAGLRRWLSVKAGKSVALAPLSTVIDKIGQQ